jgi:hypothetical protein
VRAILGSCVLLGLVALGCSSGDDGEESGPCEQRSGTYRFSFAQRSGNCGVIAEQILTIDAQPTTPPAPCLSGEIRYSSDNCEVTNINIVCPEDGVAPGATSTSNGKYRWSDSGSSGTGEVNMVVKDESGLVICQSSYSVTAVRL